MDRQPRRIEIETDHATSNMRVLPLSISVPCGYECELAPQRAQSRRRQITDHSLALVANALFVGEQQVAGPVEPEFDAIVSHRLDDFHFDAIPGDCAPCDDISWKDFQ